MFTYATTTNVGNREINEDYLIAVDNGTTGCFFVADGLGGHDLGEVASKLAAETFYYAFNAYEEGTSIGAFLDETFMKAQNCIMQEQQACHAIDKMKTTGVALMVSEQYAAWGHVGDSRLYAFYKNKVKTRTLDHSVPQMLVLAGDIKEKQIRRHPDRNRLLRVLGIPWDGKRHEISDEMDRKNFQAFLLCSDGFWELIEEKMMCKQLKKSKTVEEWLSLMTAEVEKNGRGTNMDNYTAIAVWL